MKKNLILFGALFFAVACNNSDSETTTTTDSSAAAGTTGTTDESTEASMGSSSSASLEKFDESASYVSLNTKKPVKIKRDMSRGYVVDYETNEPLNYYFYNPATRDTFDWSGNVVNGYLMKGNDGTYKLDESRWRIKVDEDGDIKAKDGDDSKIKIDASTGEAKIKTDSTKRKSKDNQ
jgi:hypothetical protein